MVTQNEHLFRSPTSGIYSLVISMIRHVTTIDSACDYNLVDVPGLLEYKDQTLMLSPNHSDGRFRVWIKWSRLHVLPTLQIVNS